MLADLALLLWIPTSLLLGVRLRPPVAATLILLGSFLLLPVGRAFDFTGVPPLDRERISVLCAALFLLAFQPRRLRSPPPEFWILAGLLLAGSFLTGLLNAAPLPRGPIQLPGMSLYDTISFVFARILDYLLPFLIGFCVFRNARDLQTLLALLVVTGLLYSPLILFELRMSPQIHNLVYGAHQNQFLQTIRFGGWRPMVLTEHGLALAVFVLATALSALALWRARLRIQGFSLALPSLYLAGLLVACKSLGAILYGIVLLPAAALLRPRLQLVLAAGLGMLVLAYPVGRAQEALPTEALIELATDFDADRGQSLGFRFHNEDLLVEKALRRPWLGWGSFGRGRVYAEEDGRDITVTDGFWIIQLGEQGLVGLLGVLGLLVAPLIRALLAASRLPDERARRVCAGLALLLAASIVDLIPNGFLHALHLLMAGALAGALRGAPTSGSGPSPPAQGSRRVRTQSR